MSNALMEENTSVMIDALESISQRLEYTKAVLETLTNCYHIDNTKISKEQLEGIVADIGNIGIVLNLVHELVFSSEQMAEETINHYYAAGKKDTTPHKKEGDASQQRRGKTD